MIVADKTGQVLYSDHGPDGPESRPEIDRSQLIDLLLSSISNNCIYWNYKILSISLSPANRWSINFDGEKPQQTFDLVIGADGAWSRVRQVLTDVKPYYSGVHCITLTI